MKKFLFVIIPGILFSQPSNAIFGTKIKGIQVQGFDPVPGGTGLVAKFVRFYYYQSGEWYVLRARAKITGGYNEGDIIQIKLKGAQLEQIANDLPSSVYFNGFSQSGPDAEGYVTLSVTTTTGASYPLLKTKWKGTQVNTYQVSGQQIRRFYVVDETNTTGYLWLCVDINQPLGEHEERPGREKGKEKEMIKIVYDLEKIEPNPAKEFVRIYYSLAKDSYVKIYAYDKTGKLVKKIIDEYEPRGIYRFFWGLDDENGNLLPQGEYFIKMEAGKFKKTKKILILK
ncbi:MAG: hypothetical protein ABIL90_02375 [candidate division WOR-3 bacterium]